VASSAHGGVTGGDGDLTERGREHVRSRLDRAGGLSEAIRGLWHKTLPVVFRTESSLSAVHLLAILARVALLFVVAVGPIIVRKALVAQPQPQPRGPVSASLLDMLSRLDATDYLIAGIALAAVFIPKVLDAIDRRKHVPKRLPYYDLSAAIEQMPSIDRNGKGRDGASERAIADAIDSVLRALREEMAELVDEPGRERITDVTLLEFCDPEGSQMRVRSRTARKDPSGRPVSSAKLMAYPVALSGKPFIEHDFLRSVNPYPKVRVTVPNSPRVTYRSILYLPILWSSLATVLPSAPGEPIAPPSLPIDMVIGMVCVNCSKAYRFWRWGDHRRVGGAFESVAYERALPYIALLTKLLEPTAHKVQLGIA